MATTLCPGHVFSLETGSPHFPVPEFLENAIATPICPDEWTEYPPLKGLPGLRDLLAQYHSQWSGGRVSSDQVLITHGAMNAIFNIFSCELKPDDEVLIPAPFWHHFPNILKHVPGRLKSITTFPENGFKLTPSLLKQAVGPGSKLLVLTTPNNPTGTFYSQQELDALADTLLEYPNLLVLIDEAYSLLHFDVSSATPCPSFRLNHAIAPRLFRVGSISKNFGLAGLRVGYIVAEPHRIEYLSQRQRFSALGVNLRLQQGAVSVLAQFEQVLDQLRNELLKRKLMASMILKQHLPQMHYLEPQAGYYFFVDVRPWLGTHTQLGQQINNDRELAGYLLQEGDLCVQPSSDCGLPGFFRLTFAVPSEIFERGIERLKQQLDLLISK